MGWHYHFYQHTEESNNASLEMLARYGGYVQLSTLIPLAVVWVARATPELWKVLSTKSRQRAYEVVSTTEEVRAEGRRSNSHINLLRLKWWLSHDYHLAGCNYGTRGQLIIRSAFMCWLLCLCFLETGDNYNQLTKRFAMVAVALFPLQFSLSMRYANPLAYALGSTHGELSTWHRFLGRLIHTFVTCHAALYANKYIQLGGFLDALRNSVVITGFAAFLAMTTLGISSLAVVRRYSYRVFLITHILIAFTLPMFVFLHVKPARVYIAQAMVILALDRGLRMWHAFTAQASIQLIPGTGLIRTTIMVPPERAKWLQKYPGSHVYITVPSTLRSIWSRSITKPNFLLNCVPSPFTVAAVNEASSELTLIVRKRNGPMTHYLNRLAGGYSQDSSSSERIPIRIEGPFGVARQFNDMLIRGSFNRILIFAGGVGATFSLPIFQHILRENSRARVDMFWAARYADDVHWAATASETEKNILEDERIHIFITRAEEAKNQDEKGEDEGVTDKHVDLEMGLVDSSCRYPAEMKLRGIRHNLQRPDLRDIVDEAFQQNLEDRVAVLVCGPLPMKRELREHVHRWVKRGRYVWWHDEAFSL
ncbi:hypothetical protein LX32DRAFT_715620 [Colletotrichum zoysiae]|uniref:FAD-binding FR-type domain-containing protein n=1 Tax=Colletotrichum zoysiae TaxID=1216348 RepID=A0AAD9H2L7_9PEZI|nr:hypothetical protein LX32DRAFT_715620 [Colletotrichum zoysiae]